MGASRWCWRRHRCLHPSPFRGASRCGHETSARCVPRLQRGRDGELHRHPHLRLRSRRVHGVGSGRVPPTRPGGGVRPGGRHTRRSLPPRGHAHRGIRGLCRLLGVGGDRALRRLAGGRDLLSRSGQRHGLDAGATVSRVTPSGTRSQHGATHGGVCRRRDHREPGLDRRAASSRPFRCRLGDRCRLRHHDGASDRRHDPRLECEDHHGCRPRHRSERNSDDFGGVRRLTRGPTQGHPPHVDQRHLPCRRSRGRHHRSRVRGVRFGRCRGRLAQCRYRCRCGGRLGPGRRSHRKEISSLRRCGGGCYSSRCRCL